MSCSTLVHGKLFGSLCLLFGLAAAFIAAVPEQAVAAGASPFAGCYTAEGLKISISGGGRISDSNDFVDLKGRIWSDGYMELTYTYYLLNFDNPRGGRRSSNYTITAVGYGDLDADGNLYGVLEWSTGSVS